MPLASDSAAGHTLTCTGNSGYKLSRNSNAVKPSITIFLAVILATLLGCSPPKTQTKFYLNRSVFNEDAGVETADAIIRSPSFWGKYVAPRLPPKIAEGEVVQSSLRLSMGATRTGEFSEVRLSFACSNRENSARFSEAIINGLSAYLADVEGRKSSDFVRRK